MHINAGQNRIESEEGSDDCHSINTAPSFTNEIHEDGRLRSSYSCLYCQGEDGSLVALKNGCMTHTLCREQQVCCYCKDIGITSECPSSACTKVFHAWCADFIGTSACDLHSTKPKTRERLQLTKLATQNMVEYAETATQVKSRFRNVYLANMCAGQILWYGIGTHYFSSASTTQHLRDLPTNTWSLCDFPYLSQTPDLDYVSHLITQYEQEQESLAVANGEYLSLIETSLQEFNQADNSAKPKRFKNLNEEEFILSHIKDRQYKSDLEDYLKYFEIKVKQDVSPQENVVNPYSKCGHREPPKCEDDFVCGVCGDGDYEDDDLIVICSVRNI
jgi:hypothetical protein